MGIGSCFTLCVQYSMGIGVAAVGDQRQQQQTEVVVVHDSFQLYEPVCARFVIVYCTDRSVCGAAGQDQDASREEPTAGGRGSRAGSPTGSCGRCRSWSRGGCRYARTRWCRCWPRTSPIFRRGALAKLTAQAELVAVGRPGGLDRTGRFTGGELIAGVTIPGSIRVPVARLITPGVRPSGWELFEALGTPAQLSELAVVVFFRTQPQLVQTSSKPTCAASGTIGTQRWSFSKTWPYSTMAIGPHFWPSGQSCSQGSQTSPRKSILPNSSPPPEPSSSMTSSVAVEVSLLSFWPLLVPQACPKVRLRSRAPERWLGGSERFTRTYWGKEILMTCGVVWSTT